MIVRSTGGAMRCSGRAGAWSRLALCLATLAGALATAALGDSTELPLAPPADRAADPVVAESMRALVAAPMDADVWVRMRDGKGLVASPEAEALVRSLIASLLEGEGRERWTKLSRRLGWSEREAFERLLGTDARCAVRTAGVEGASSDWAILTTVAPRDVEHVVRALRGTIEPSGRFEVPEEHLRLAYRAPWLAIGPARERGKGAVAMASRPVSLFDDLAERWTAPLAPAVRQGEGEARSLAESLAARGLTSLPGGRLTAAFRIGSPFDGVGSLGADIDGGSLRATFRGAFPQPPLPGLKSTTLDVSLLARFKDRAILACVDPVRTEVRPDDAPLVALLPELVPHGAFRANLGEFRLVVVGETVGDALRAPAVAVAYPVCDAEQAREDQDALMKAAFAGINERLARPRGITLSEPVVPAEGARVARIGPLLADLTDDHPLVRSWCVSWEVVKESMPESPHAGADGARRCRRAWQVYATDTDWLAAVHGTLADGARGGGGERVQAAHAGCACGGRLAVHLRSWSNEAAAFAGPDAKQGDVEEFKAGVELIASIAERFGPMRWTLDAPDACTITLELEAELAPPTSGGAPGR